jgi:protein-S-isoprenylcysteine O-methyltransferase Ste14
VIYRGTSVSLWVVEGMAAIFAVAFVAWFALQVLLFAAVLALIAVVAFLLWWAWLELGDWWADRRARPRSNTRNTRSRLSSEGTR